MPEVKWRRSSLRLPEYDYADFGAVFVTICTHHRQALFGTVTRGEVSLSPPGIAVQNAWNALPSRFAHIELDEFIIMPDHLHGILLTGTSQSSQTRPVMLGDVINAFKNMVIAAWRYGVRDEDWPRYHDHLWQRAFYDHVISDERDLNAIREYILGNPVRWEQNRRGYM